MAPAAVASALLPPEIQFAQRLAANEKRIRDRALKKLRGYVALRTQRPAGSFSQEEFLKIWKGLFYCLWMQDKPLLQEELSNNISQLIHVIENMDARHLFIQTFWQTMNREWNGIDRLRLDKFYMLIRMVLRQSFEVLKRNGWNESFTEPFLNLLMKEVIHPESNAPIGIKLHFIDIYLEELAKVGAKELTADQNLKFIEPLCSTTAKTKDHILLQAITRGVFETIVDQCPFAVEDLMRELRAGSDDDLSEDDWSDEENKLVAKDRSLLCRLQQDGEGQENLSEVSDDNIGPVLQFDYKKLADMLFELASRKNTPAFNRKRLYKLVKKFQDLAEGIFPQDDFPEDVSTDEDDDTFSRRKWKRKSGKPLEKTKLDKEDNAGNKTIATEEDGGNTGLQKKRKKRKRKLSQVSDMLTASGCHQNVPVILEESKELNQDTESTNVKKRQKKSLGTEANETVLAANPLGGSLAQKTLTCLISSIKKKPKKKSSTLQKVPIETVHQNGQVPTSTKEILDRCAPRDHINKVTKQKQKKEFGIVTGNGFSEEAVNQSKKKSCAGLTSSVFQKVKLRKKQKLSSLEKMRGSKKKIVRLKNKKKIKRILNTVQENELEAENKKCKTSETSGIATVMLQKKKAKAGNDFVKFEKTTLPKPVFFRKAKGSITSMQLTKLQSSISKKVTFGLNKNMTAEFKKTDKSILVSPQGSSRVAFNPEQKPLHGVLKLASVSSAGMFEIKESISVPAKKRPTAVDFF